MSFACTNGRSMRSRHGELQSTNLADGSEACRTRKIRVSHFVVWRAASLMLVLW